MVKPKKLQFQGKAWRSGRSCLSPCVIAYPVRGPVELDHGPPCDLQFVSLRMLGDHGEIPDRKNRPLALEFEPAAFASPWRRRAGEIIGKSKKRVIELLRSGFASPAGVA